MYGPELETAEIGSPRTGVRPLKELEREAIEQALKRVNGNRRQAAEMLGNRVAHPLPKAR